MRGRTLCLACGAFVMALFLLLTLKPPPLYNDPTLEGETVSISGTVSSAGYRNDKLQIFLKGVLISGSALSETKTAYLTGTGQRPAIGSRIRVTGTFRSLERPRNPGGFDLAAYYGAKGVDFMLTGAKITGASKNYDRAAESLCRLRERMEEILDRYLDTRSASVLKAMLLGDKGFLDDEVKGVFERSGCSHLLVISGLHIAIIGSGLYKLMKRCALSPGISALAGSVFILFYGMLTGMGSATKRAVIMYILCLFASAAGRAYDMPTAMALSCVISLVPHPLLIFDSGFLLSFGAVTGIAFLLPVFGRACEDIRIKPLKKLTGALCPPLCVSLSTLPFLLYFFGRYPVYSMLLNLVMVPTAGAVIAGGFALCAVGAAQLSGLSALMALLIRAALEGYIAAASFCSKLPGALLITGRPEWYETAVYCLLIFLPASLASGRGEKKLLTPKKAAVIMLLAPFFLLLRSPVGGGMDLVMLDVGQGDCILARTDANCIMTDCGSSSEKDIGRYTVLPALRALGIAKVDLMALTHGDADHINGMEYLLENAETEGIALSRIAMTGNMRESPEGERLATLAEKMGVEVLILEKGDSVRAGDMHLECIFPDPGMRGEANELSMVTVLDYGDFSALLTGDMEGMGEEVCTRRLSGRPFTVYKAAHHGSRNSNTEAFLEKALPLVTLISCGEGNSYGHPHREALERIEKTGSRIFITAEKGAVCVHTDGVKSNVRTYLK